MKALKPADRFRRRPFRVLDQRETLGTVHDPRQRRVRRQLRGQCDRAAAWPAAARRPILRWRPGSAQLQVAE